MRPVADCIPWPTCDDSEKYQHWRNIHRRSQQVSRIECLRDRRWAIVPHAARLAPSLPAWLDEQGFHACASWLRACGLRSLPALQAIPFEHITEWIIASLQTHEQQSAALEVLVELAKLLDAQWPLLRSERRELRKLEW